MTYTHCFARDEKPGKNEVPQTIRVWMTARSCPNCDKKRTTTCQDPNCVRRKS